MPTGRILHAGELRLRLLRTLNLQHQVDTIKSDADFHRWESRTGMRTFPQIVMDNQVIGGYDELTSLHASGALESIR